MIDILIKTTVILVLVAGAAHLTRRNSAALRHLLWTFATITLLAIPLLSTVVPFRWRVLPSPTSTPAQGTDLRVREEHAAVNEHKASAPVATDLSSSTVPAAPAPSRFILPSIETRTLLLGVWAFGALLLIGRFGIGMVRVRRIARRAPEVTDEAWLQLADRAGKALGVGAAVELRSSNEVAMPFACGLGTPVIVLPASASEWSVERREAVLMHEFAHISRGDLTMNAISHVARALYWFNPLAWLAAYRLRVEGERACDDAVLRAGARPSDYAEHLLDIVRTVGNTVPNVALAMARRSDFEGRLLAILEPGIPRGKLTRLRAAGLAALFLGAVMPLAAMAPASPVPAEMKTGEFAVEATPQERPQGEPSQGRERASNQENTAAVNALIETLTDGNPAVRLAAVTSLGTLEDPRAIAALAKALKDDTDARVREAAAHSLGEIDDTRAVPHLLEALKSERIANVKEQIVQALGEIDDPQAVSGVAALARDPSVLVRRAVASALSEFDDPSAVPALTSMARDEDVEVRQNVAHALGELESASAFDALATLARDTHHDVRNNAIEALNNLEDIRALSIFIAALKDEHADVRQNAADAIHNIDGITSAPPALIEALRDPNRDVRKQVAHALGGIGDAAAVPALRRAVSDPDTEVRRTAVESLKEIGGVDAMQALMALLKDSDPEVRRIAAEALGKKRE